LPERRRCWQDPGAMRRAHTLIALLALVVFPATAAGRPTAVHPPALARLTSTPALSPAFSPAIHDYVVRCTTAARTRFTTVAAAGSRPEIDGTPERTALVPLHADQAVTISAVDGAGSSDYHVRCLPADFPGFTETWTAHTDEWYVTTPSLSLGTARSHYIAIFDGDGVPVWWYRARHVPIDAKILSGALVAFSSFPASTPEYQVRRLDGAFVRRIVSPDGRADDHELQVAANGDDVFVVYQPKSGIDLTPYGGPADATVLEGEIEEVSPAGKLVWSWSTDGHVGLDATAARFLPGIVSAPVTVPLPGGGSVPAYDFFHPNAVSLDGGTVLFSMRQTDAVYAIDKASGKILWKLGGSPTPESLTVVGDPYGQVPFGGQHDVRILPDGTVSAYDDGTLLGRPPRAVRYRIDTSARTATLVEQVSDPAVTSSLCCGSARLLRDGDWVVSWGGDPVAGEYRPDGSPVWKIEFDGLFSYRVAPVAGGKLTIAELRAGMDALAKR
jgi:Arylsulfotransferase (ASST)